MFLLHDCACHPTILPCITCVSRYTSQVKRPKTETNGNSEIAATRHWSAHTQELRAKDRLPASPASPESRMSQQTAKEEGKIVDPPTNKAPGRSREQREQPKTTRADNRAHGRKFPSSDSMRLNRSAQGRREAVKMAESARESFSATLRSSVNGQREGGEAGGRGKDIGSTAAAAAIVDRLGDGGGDTNPNIGSLDMVTTRQQQRHRGLDDAPRTEAFLPSGADPIHPHPHRIGAKRGNAVDGRDGWSTSASSPSSSSESKGLPYEDPVGHPLTGLADIDIATTMDGLLDREARKEPVRGGVVGQSRLLRAESSPSQLTLLIVFRGCR